MDSYLLEIKSSVRKELEALPDAVLARVTHKIDLLAHTPRPTGCLKLRGYKDQWRVRVGEWRVLYVIDDAAKVVNVTRIAHRKDVYEP